MLSKRSDKYFPVLILFVYFSIALYKLDSIPGEWYGDISNVHEYVTQILSGKWPLYFFQNTGPVYHYLISPIIYILGNRYFQYKIASVSVGGLVVVATYLMAKALSGKKIAYITTFIALISFWTIVWARTGNSQILIPVLSASTVYFAEKYNSKKRFRELLFGVLVSSAGLFTYPQTFILPILLILWLLYRKNFKAALISMSLIVPVILLFSSIVARGKDNFTSGYVGTKIPKIENFYVASTYKNMATNLVKTLGMFHFRGDVSFRVNVSNTPQLDILSGLLLLFGIYYWFKKNRAILVSIIFSILFLSLPSISPALPPIEIPNSGRTIAITPFVYMLVASGIYFIYKKINGDEVKFVSLLLILLVIMVFNLNKYFYLYPKNLSNENVSYGKIIASYIDENKSDILIKLTSCCWGEWGQPEPKAIYYQLRNRKGRENIVYDYPFLKDCKELEDKNNVILIFNPSDELLIEKFKGCYPGAIKYDHREKGYDVFSAVYIP